MKKNGGEKSHATVPLSAKNRQKIPTPRKFLLNLSLGYVPFNPILPEVSGDLFSLGKEISCLVPPHSVWRETGN